LSVSDNTCDARAYEKLVYDVRRMTQRLADQRVIPVCAIHYNWQCASKHAWRWHECIL